MSDASKTTTAVNLADVFAKDKEALSSEVDHLRFVLRLAEPYLVGEYKRRDYVYAGKDEIREEMTRELLVVIRAVQEAIQRK